MEGRLDQSPHIKKHIPRGELIELLSKALLYTEVEAHWKGDELTTNCSAPFSLLDPHTCSLQSASSALEQGAAKVNGDTAGKRKASTPSEDSRAEKRARKEQNEKDGASVPRFLATYSYISKERSLSSQNQKTLN